MEPIRVLQMILIAFLIGILQGRPMWLLSFIINFQTFLKLAEGKGIGAHAEGEVQTRGGSGVKAGFGIGMGGNGTGLAANAEAKLGTLLAAKGEVGVGTGDFGYNSAVKKARGPTPSPAVIIIQQPVVMQPPPPCLYNPCG